MIVVHIDVLAQQPEEPLSSRPPSPEGRRLWNTLFEPYKGRMAITAGSAIKTDLLEHWLKKEQFKASYVHQYDEAGFCRVNSSPRADGAWFINSNLGKVTWYIDTHVEACSQALHMGIPTLLVAVPLIHRPEWGTEKEIKPWESITNELEEQAIKRSAKTWGDA